MGGLIRQNGSKILFLLGFGISRPEINNASTQDLANQLQTVLGTYRLLSLTSSATNGVVVTTMAYDVPDE